jgi:hypothetical protein
MALTDPYPIGVTTITLSTEDECGNPASCQFTVTVNPCVLKCETAFGYKNSTSSRCFLLDGFSRWGWTTKITGNATLKLYAGAGQCDISKGLLAGTVQVIYSGSGSVTLIYNMYPGYTLSEVHVYVGYAKYPLFKNGKKTTPTVAPGQYPVGVTGLNNVTTYTVNYPGTFTGPIYVIAHAVTCYAETAFKSAEVVTPDFESNNLKVYPNPFSEQVTFEFVSGVDARALLEIDNMLGQRVATLMDGWVEKGVLNRAQFKPMNSKSGIYIYKLILNGNVQTGKVIYKE